MFYTPSEGMFAEKTEGREGTRVPLHNTDNHGESSQSPEEEEAANSSDPDDVDDAPSDNEGTWGERDVGGPVNFRNAMLDFEDMQKDLSTLSKTRTGKSGKSVKSGDRKRSIGIGNLPRARTWKSEMSGKSDRKRSLALNRSFTSRSHQMNRHSKIERDGEAEAQESEDDDDDDDDDEYDVELRDFLRDGHFEKRQEGRSAKKVGVVYKNLTVQGVGATSTFVKTLPSAVIGVRDLGSLRMYQTMLIIDVDFWP